MKHLFYVLIFFTFSKVFSQSPEKIKFQKNSTLIYFFQKSANKDSVVNSSNDLFYLVVPDSLKKHIVIYVENGKLIRTSNDSLVRLTYMKGLKYESQFVISEMTEGQKKLKREFELISLIDGTTTYPKDKLLIQVLNKKEEKVLIENVFFYRN